ncbi:MAG: murein biosynthesis integral membrane protein MurJ [Clostridia bacterium]|nr:murein biosynthesis integral membrane protein MurJ [Clostridia bacterium]
MHSEQKSKIVQAAGLLMLTMVISRLLGYLRDVFIYDKFGQNRITDAYNAAFSVPDFIYMILVGGALSAAFIPVFSSYIAKNQEDEGWQVVSIIFNWVAVLLFALVGIGYLFTPQLINILVPGFNAQASDMAVNLTRIMFLQVIFMSLSGISMGVLHSYKIFWAPAVGSVCYNLGIILGGLLLAAPIEKHFPGYGIAGFSVGVVVGAAINFLVQVPSLRKVGVRYHFSFNLRHPGVQKLMILMLPVLIGLSVTQINLFINQNLASNLPEGMVAALRTAQRIMQVPIGVFAIAIAVAVFPTLTGQYAKGEHEEFLRTTSLGLRAVIFITVPAAVGLAVMREPLIRFMFEFKGGAFLAENTAVTAQALLYYCIGLFAYGSVQLLARVFYALQDTKTPVIMGVVSIAVNIACSLLLIKSMAQGGLALAYSLAGIANLLLLLIMLRRKLGTIDGRRLLISFCKTLALSAFMGAIAFGIYSGWEAVFGIGSKLLQTLELLIACTAAAASYFLIAPLLHMEEGELVIKMLKRRFGRKKRAAVKQD